MPDPFDISADNHSDHASWHQHALQLTAAYSLGLGMPLMCVDTRTGQVVGKSDGDLLCTLGNDVLSHFQGISCPRVHRVDSGLVYFAIPLPVKHALALGYTLGESDQRPTTLTLEAARQGWSRDKLERWIGRLSATEPVHLQRRLDAVTEQLREAQLDGPLRNEADDTAMPVEQSLGLHIGTLCLALSCGGEQQLHLGSFVFQPLEPAAQNGFHLLLRVEPRPLLADFFTEETELTRR